MRGLLLASAMFPFVFAAEAEGLKLESTTYVGLQGLWMKADTAKSLDLKDTGFGYGVVAGWRAHKYLGLEASAEQWSSSLTVSADHTRENTMRTFAGDLYAYYPLGKEGWFEPFVTGGFGYATTHARAAYEWTETITENGTTTKKRHRDTSFIMSGRKFVVRAGAGVEWLMGHRFAGRVTARYEPYRFADNIRDGLGVSLSLLVRI